MALDIMAAFNQPPPDLDFVWPGLLAGTVGGLVAPGATGKSYWTLEATMCVSCAVAGGDVLGLQPTKAGRVLYLAAEDPEPVLINRIHAIGQHLAIEARTSIAQNLRIEPLLGKRLNVLDDRQLARIIEVGQGFRLIVLDTLSRIHTLNENDNGQMAQLLSVLEHIASETGAALLFLHHVGKNAGREGATDQQAARGASALVDNARWAGYVTRMTSAEAEQWSMRHFDREPIGEADRHSFIRFGVSKNNYGERLPDRWYQRVGGGVLLPAEIVPTRIRTGRSSTRSTEEI